MKYHVRVHHLHDGNSTPRDRQNSVYMTVAKLVDKKGNTVRKAVARCRKGDAPSRREGRVLAISRLFGGNIAI